MKQYITTDKRNNYKRCVIILRDKKGRKTHGVHRLLALAFIPNPNNLETIDHININSLDNRLSNLRWASQQKQTLNQHKRKDNTTGITGVNIFKNKAYRAMWKNNNKQHSKSFSIKKYGADEALRLAIEYRGLMVEKHYSKII